MPSHVFVSICTRNIHREGDSRQGPTFTFESGPPNEDDFHLMPDGDCVELEMKGSDILDKPATQPAHDMILTVRLSLKTCSQLVGFLQTRGLLDIQVRT